MAVVPRCLRCWMFILSGPVDLFVLLSLIAVETSSSVTKKCGSVGSCLMSLSVFLFDLSVLYLATCVNCLVKAVAMCLAEVRVLPLKVMDWFDDGVAEVPERFLIVFHRMCVLTLWSQFPSSVFCHRSERWVEISLLIWRFWSMSVGSFLFAFLVESLIFILSSMLFGSGMWCELILPLGM